MCQTYHNQFEPVLQIRQQVLRSYCPTLPTIAGNCPRNDSALHSMQYKSEQCSAKLEDSLVAPLIPFILFFSFFLGCFSLGNFKCRWSYYILFILCSDNHFFYNNSYKIFRRKISCYSLLVSYNRDWVY